MHLCLGLSRSEPKSVLHTSRKTREGQFKFKDFCERWSLQVFEAKKWTLLSFLCARLRWWCWRIRECYKNSLLCNREWNWPPLSRITIMVKIKRVWRSWEKWLRGEKYVLTFENVWEGSEDNNKKAITFFTRALSVVSTRK